VVHYPCVVDGAYFENTRIAHRSLFLRDSRVSYDKLQRALKRGKRELYGHRIERVTPRFAVGQPLRFDDDGADLVFEQPEKPERKQDGRHLLLRYPPGESPLERGLPESWH
jgi:hypothetical protein